LPDAVVFHLPFGDQVSHLDAAEQDACTPEILEPEHGVGMPLDRAVVLVDDIVQVLRLPVLDWRFALGVDGFQRSHTGVTFVDRHRLRFAILGDRFFEIPARSSLIPMGPQQKIDGVASLVDGAIQVLAINLNVGLPDAPTLADGAFVAAKTLSPAPAAA
jgi:hypothetical protein